AESTMAKAAQLVGVRFAAEGFADRMYEADGTLRDRQLPDALIENEQLATAQALDFVLAKKVKTYDGSVMPINIDTICVHGDGKNALNFAKILRGVLAENGVDVHTLVR
ncbi:MAG: LamB/YcsF family protein, partial [Saprospiraceae bacterium]|nr:LamB/YcsF family protein [Saprospiraceae bacterium]